MGVVQTTQLPKVVVAFPSVSHHPCTWLAAILYFLSRFETTWTGLYSEEMSFAGQCHGQIPQVSLGSSMSSQQRGMTWRVVSLVANDPLSTLYLLLLPHHSPDRAAFFLRTEPTSD